MKVLDRRRSGVLLHPTSLPGPGSVGRLGAEALRFVDFLAAAGFSVWQTLPLNPRDQHGSPYSSSSVFALDFALLDPLALVDDGWVENAVIASTDDEVEARAAVADTVLSRLDSPEYAALRDDFDTFIREQGYWLDDYALYEVLRREEQRPWYDWPAPLRDRDPRALADARQRHAEALRRTRMLQFLLDRQWRRLRHHARGRQVCLLGDLPFFVAHDSADVWARPELFRLDDEGRMTVNTGVPPDYFSASGQVWGMPQYNWSEHAVNGYRWWIQRVERQLELFDLMRLDHFRGLCGTWHVPAAGEPDARSGEWQPGPGRDWLEALEAALGALPLVAEDLGEITPEVEQLRRGAQLPGMRVLQFAFDSDAANPHLPHNYEPNTLAYTGTHDNNTLAGWWNECDSGLRERVAAYMGYPSEPPRTALQRLALASVAWLAVLPMQDLLDLGVEARMNTPGTARGNWSWRLQAMPDDSALMAHYFGLNALYGRLVDTGTDRQPGAKDRDGPFRERLP